MKSSIAKIELITENAVFTFENYSSLVDFEKNNWKQLGETSYKVFKEYEDGTTIPILHEGINASHDLVQDVELECVVEQSVLKVTEVRLFIVKEPQGKLRAFVRVVLNDELQLTSLRLYEGSNGLFVSYPNDPTLKGEDYRQIFYPVSKELREHIEAVVLAEYAEVIK